MTDDVEQLQARVAELELQLAEQARQTNAIRARAQEQLYWLERWGVDLERVMQRRSAQFALSSLKRVRGVVRFVRKRVRT